MKWTAVRIAVLVLALVASHSACATACTTVPPCHQQHGMGGCGHLVPAGDLAVPVVPVPIFAVEWLNSRDSFAVIRMDWSTSWMDSVPIGTALRI